MGVLLREEDHRPRRATHREADSLSAWTCRSFLSVGLPLAEAILDLEAVVVIGFMVLGSFLVSWWHRWRAWRGLRDSIDAELRTLFDSSPIGVLVWDPARSSVIYANPRSRLFCAHPEDKDFTFDCFAQAISCPHERERLLFFFKSKPKVWIPESFLVRYQAGSRTGSAQILIQPTEIRGRELVVFWIIDVTEHEALAASLSRAERYYRNLLEGGSDVVHVIDQEGRLCYVSPAVERVLGWTPSDLEGKPGAWLVHPDDLSFYFARAANDHASAEMNSNTTLVRLKHANGSWRICDLRLVRGRDPEGRAIWVGHARDVTDLVHAHQALAESEERFRQLAEHIDQVFWIGSPDRQRCFYVSPSFERIWGVPTQTLIESGFSAWFNAIHPEDRSRVNAIPILQEGGKFEVEYRIVRPDGTTRWVLDRAFPVFDARGVLTRIVGVAEDITERRQAENAVRESARLIWEMASTIEDVFWVVSIADRRFTFISPNAQWIFGSEFDPSSHSPIRTFLRIVHPEDRTKTIRCIRRVLHGLPEDWVVRIRRSRSQIRWIRVRVYPVRDASHTLVRLLGVAEDITDRERALDRLRQSEARNRLIIGSSPDGILSLDRSGRIVEVNEAGRRLFAIPSDRAVHGRKFVEFFAPEDRHEVERAIASAEVGRADLLTCDVLRSDGRRLVIELRVSSLEDHGEVVGTLCICRDVTEARERDRLLRRYERLASVGTLLAGVSHELSNPLASIIGIADLLIANPSTIDENSIQMIRNEAQRAAAIVQRLLQTARRSHDVRRERRAVNLGDIVRSCLESRLCRLDTAGIETVVTLADDLPPVIADPYEMEQVVLNLLINARQVLEGWNGPKRVEITTAREGDFAVLTVRDSGPGIPPHIVPRVFDPFFTTKPPGVGSGLGLYMVHGIIADHQGTVECFSTPGNGATFEIRLPLRREPSASDGISIDGVAAPPAPADRMLRVLIIDDEGGIRFALSGYLRLRGHDVVEATDGASALEILREQGGRFDVILSDLRMPGLSGKEFMTHLDGLLTPLRNRVVFMTGATASIELMAFLRATGRPYLVKPFQLADATALIERVAAESQTGLITGPES